MDDERSGFLKVGELPEIRRRERVAVKDFSQAQASAREKAFQEVLAFVIEREAASGPYDDTRPWSETKTYLQDRIRENGAT